MSDLDYPLPTTWLRRYRQTHKDATYEEAIEAFLYPVPEERVYKAHFKKPLKRPDILDLIQRHFQTDTESLVRYWASLGYRRSACAAFLQTTPEHLSSLLSDRHIKVTWRNSGAIDGKSRVTPYRVHGQPITISGYSSEKIPLGPLVNTLSDPYGMVYGDRFVNAS